MLSPMLRILFFSANPASTPTLSLQAEFRALEDRLRTDGRSACVELRPVSSGTLDVLERELRNFSPDVLHFAGHGTANVVLIEGNQHQRVDMPYAALGEIVQRLAPQLRCLVLGTCRSAGKAEALLAQVPCLVAMQAEVADSTAVRFSTSYYAALAAGDTLGAAFSLARNSISATSRPGPEVPAFFARPKVGDLPLVRKLRVFSLHAPEDGAAYNDLRRALAVYRRAGVLDLSGPQDAPATSDKERFCEDELAAADVILCLTSDNFLANDRCYELTRLALRRREAGEAAVMNLLMGHSSWQSTELGHLQPLPRSGAPLSAARKDSWWHEVTIELRAALRSVETRLLAIKWEIAADVRVGGSEASVRVGNDGKGAATNGSTGTEVPPQPPKAGPSTKQLNNGELLERLSALLPAQFEVILMKLGVSVAVLSPSTVPQVMRAVELIRFLESQTPSGVPALCRLL